MKQSEKSYVSINILPIYHEHRLGRPGYQHSEGLPYQSLCDLYLQLHSHGTGQVVSALLHCEKKSTYVTILHFTIKCKQVLRMKGYNGLNESNLIGIVYTTVRADNNGYNYVLFEICNT